MFFLLDLLKLVLCTKICDELFKADLENTLKPSDASKKSRQNRLKILKRSNSCLSIIDRLTIHPGLAGTVQF